MFSSGAASAAAGGAVPRATPAVTTNSAPTVATAGETALSADVLRRCGGRDDESPRTKAPTAL